MAHKRYKYDSIEWLFGFLVGALFTSSIWFIFNLYYYYHIYKKEMACLNGLLDKLL